MQMGKGPILYQVLKLTKVFDSVWPRLGSREDLLETLLSWWTCTIKRVEAAGVSLSQENLITDCCYTLVAAALGLVFWSNCRLLLHSQQRLMEQLCHHSQTCFLTRTEHSGNSSLAHLTNLTSQYSPTYVASSSTQLLCTSLNFPHSHPNHSVCFDPFLADFHAWFLCITQSQLKCLLFTEGFLGHIITMGVPLHDTLPSSIFFSYHCLKLLYVIVNLIAASS